MRVIRLFFICLAVIAALALLIVGAGFSPVVQLWFFNRQLAQFPSLHASVESVWAGFSSVEFTTLRVERDGIVLTAPSLTVQLPVKTALWDRRLLVGTLVAKGWTLDLTGRPATGAKETPTATGPTPAHDQPAAPPIATVLLGLLNRLELPCDLALDGVELEGDVLTHSSTGPNPASLHVVIKGGKLSPAHAGEFELEAGGRVPIARLSSNRVAIRGRVNVGLKTPRTFDRVEFIGRVTSAGAALPPDLDVSAAIATDATPTFRLEFIRGTRRLASFTANVAKDSSAMAGTWRLDLRESDLAPFFPDRPWPEIVATGEGQFDADATITRVHAGGRMKTIGGKLGTLSPALNRVDAATVETGFDLTHSGQSLRFARLDFSVGTSRPVAVVQSAQAFTLDEHTGEVKPANSDTDWLRGSLRDFPLTWIPALPEKLLFVAGNTSGDFTVRAADGGFVARSSAPLAATKVALQRDGRVLARDVDLSAGIAADYSAKNGWHAQFAPLTVDSAGHRLADLDLNLSPTAAGDKRLMVAATWQADLVAMAAQPAIFGARWIKGRTASGDFSAKFGNGSELSGTINLTGRNAANSLTVKGSVYLDGYGGTSFRLPVHIASGAEATEFTAEGTCTVGKSATQLRVELSAVKASLDHVLLFAGALPFISTPAWSAQEVRPFWGDTIGSVNFSCYQLLAGAHELNQVEGAFKIARDSIHLQDGRAKLASPPVAKADRNQRSTSSQRSASVLTAEGDLSFDAKAAAPYTLKATARVDVLDAAQLFGAPPAGRDPTIEGRYALTDTLTGAGRNLAEAAAHRQEEIHLTSDAGIIRFLKASVANAIPETPTPVADTMATVGNLVVGTIFGVKGQSFGTGKNPLTPAADAVLNFTYVISELGYDRLAVTATRGADHVIHLRDIAITMPSEQLTGSGTLTPAQGKPLGAWPLQLDLRLGIRGPLVKSLAPAALLSDDKDAAGFNEFRESLRFGGTLDQIDASQWQSILAKAVAPTPAGNKKGG